MSKYYDVVLNQYDKTLSRIDSELLIGGFDDKIEAGNYANSFVNDLINGEFEDRKTQNTYIMDIEIEEHAENGDLLQIINIDDIDDLI